MSYAILNPDGIIREVVRKLLPGMLIAPGERIVDHNPPDFDAQTQTCTPVQPVPADQAAVSFVVEERPDAPQVRAQRKLDDISATLAKARVLRVPILSILDGMQASAVATGQAALALDIELIKQALKDITTTDLSACTTRAEMENTILAAYYAICQAAPAQVQSAFNSLVP